MLSGHPQKFQSYFWWMVRWKTGGSEEDPQNQDVSILLLVDGEVEELLKA